MSVLTLRISVRHEGKTIPRFPLTRRIEDSTHVAQLLDVVWPDNDPQEPGSATGTPFAVMRFDQAVRCQMGTYTGLLPFDMQGGGIVIYTGSGGVSFAPLAAKPIRVQGVV